MAFDLKEIIASRLGENYDLHEKHLNRTLVQAQRVIGFDKIYARAEGAYLYDMDNQPYLDFLSGYSVFNIGRNHPIVKQAIRDVLDLDLPNMVQMDCSLLSGLLAEALTKRTPSHLNAVFFCNSGTEAMEGALKFARAATGRKRAVSLASAFHGLSLGSLSLMGCESFTEGFGPLMEGFDARVPLDDIEALDRQLGSRDVAAFVIETVQGKGCQTSKTDFLVRAQELCRKYGTLLMEKVDTLRAKHSFIKEVRGKGLMIGIEFHEPQEFKLKMAWKLLHKIDKVLFAQMIVTQMLSKHRILTQVAGHAMDVMKILPPLIIGEREIDMFVNALDDVLMECRRFPGPMWELGNNFVKAAVGSSHASEKRSAIPA